MFLNTLQSLTGVNFISMRCKNVDTLSDTMNFIMSMCDRVFTYIAFILLFIAVCLVCCQVKPEVEKRKQKKKQEYIYIRFLQIIVYRS